MASIGASFDSAFAGLQNGVEQARKAGAELSVHSKKLEESTSSSDKQSDDGKGSYIDVTA